MRRLRLSTLAAACLALAAATPRSGLAAPDTPPRKTPTPAPAPDPLSGPLAERIAGKRGLGDVDLELLWERAGARVYGTGVGICSEASQIRVPRAEVIALLEAIRKAHFGSMPGHFGELEAKDMARLKGRLRARIGDLSKTVFQMQEGEQSAELAALAARLLKVCGSASKTGVSAANLPDGLGKLVSGKLAPEAFEALVQRRESGAAAGSAPDNWILRIEGRRASDRLMPVGQKPGPPRELALSEKQFRQLVELLSSNGVASLPGSISSPQYTDLRVKILNREKSVAGRRLGGEQAESSSASREAFDRIYEGLRKLHLEVRQSGRDASPSVELRSPESEKEEEEEREREKERERPKPIRSPSPAGS